MVEDDSERDDELSDDELSDDELRKDKHLDDEPLAESKEVELSDDLQVTRGATSKSLGIAVRNDVDPRHRGLCWGQGTCYRRQWQCSTNITTEVFVLYP